MQASQKIDEVLSTVDDVASGKLEDVESSAGPLMSAGLGALRAVISGKNPVSAALKGAWSGASTKAKVIVVLCLVPISLLALVAVVLLLLGLLVAAIVLVIRSAIR